MRFRSIYWYGQMIGDNDYNKRTLTLTFYYSRLLTPRGATRPLDWVRYEKREQSTLDVIEHAIYKRTQVYSALTTRRKLQRKRSLLEEEEWKVRDYCHSKDTKWRYWIRKWLIKTITQGTTTHSGCVWELIRQVEDDDEKNGLSWDSRMTMSFSSWPRPLARY